MPHNFKRGSSTSPMFLPLQTYSQLLGRVKVEGASLICSNTFSRIIFEVMRMVIFP